MILKVDDGLQVVALLNNRHFNLIEEHTCKAYVVREVTNGSLKTEDTPEQTAAPKVSPRGSSVLFERMTAEWRCSVCIEGGSDITEIGGGAVLEILCGHTFHSRCLARWVDQTCPVCRFQQYPFQQSSCDECNTQDHALRICLVCGFIGCTREGDHAAKHFAETKHAYALEPNSQRVWDYAGEGYVYRLLTNTDGKMVEHTPMHHSSQSSILPFDPELV